MIGDRRTDLYSSTRMKDEILVIKVDLDNTDYGYDKERIRWLAEYTRGMDAYYLRDRVLIAHNEHKIQIVPIKNHADTVMYKIFITINMDSNDRDLKQEKKKWINYYSKQLGGKELKHHIIMMPSDHSITMININYFNENILT